MKLHSLFKLRKFELTPPICAIIVSFLAAFCAHVSFADVFLVEENPNAEAPYDTWEKAATNYGDAIGALTAGATLWISNGTYTATALSGHYTLPEGSAIRSVNGPDVTKLDFGNAKAAFILNKANTMLAGLHIYKSYRENNGAVDMTVASAMVTNCIFESCNRLNKATIYLTAGTFVDCTVKSCESCGWVAGSYGPRAVDISGSAVMDRCRIVNHSSNNASKGIVKVGGNAIVRNTIFKGNSVMGVGAVWLGGSGSIENCTIAGNTTRGLNTYATHACAVYIETLTASVKNTIIVRNVDLSDHPADIDGIDGCEACFTSCFLAADGDPGFLDAVNGDYHLTPSSPCLDQATTLDWMATGKDLDGNPRIDDTLPDIGCYEYIWPSEEGVTLFRKVVGDDEFAPQTDELRAVITPRTLAYDPANCWWTFDGTEPSESNHQAVGDTVTNVFGKGMHTVRFRVRISDAKTLGKDETDWFEVLNNKVYLVEENPNAAAPYDTWETAATSLADALGCLAEGYVLLVSNGTYATTAAISGFVVPKNATIRSVNGAETVTFDYGGSRIPFQLSNLGSVVSGIRFYNCWAAYTPAMRMTQDATIRDCIFDTCTVNGGPSTFSASKGKIVGCTFTGCRSGTGYTIPAFVGMVTGSAVVDQCRFVGNQRGLGQNEAYGVITVKDGGTVRNSLFADNRTPGCCGIYIGANGHAENCTLVGNVMDSTAGTYSTSHPVYLADLSGEAKNLIVVQNVDSADNLVDAISGVEGYEDCCTACFTDADGDPGFNDPLVWDYSLLPVSDCVDVGDESDWMAAAQDLAGNPRIFNDIPDIGAYEYTESSEPGVAIYHTVIGSGVFAPQTNEFRAVITPRTLEYDPEDCWWTFDGTEPSESNHQAVGPVVTNAVEAGSVTVRFRVKAGEATYGDDKGNWFAVQSAYVYLVKDNPGAVAPYTTWATAAATFDDAFQSLGEGQTIVASNGTFSLKNNPYTLPKYAGVKSVNGPTNVTFTVSNQNGAFILPNLGGFLEGVKLSKAGYTYSSAVTLSQDVRVENCIFDSCSAHAKPCAIEATQGTIVNCVFNKGSGWTWGANGGLAIVANGNVTIDRCRFEGVTHGGNTTESQGAISVANGAVVRNSFVTGTQTGGCAGIYVGANGRAENCTVVKNDSQGNPLADSYAVYAKDETAAIVNVISVNNTRTDGEAANAGGASEAYTTCFTSGDPLFSNVETGDYTLKANSPCINEGTVLDWMTEDAVDLAGHPRLNGEQPDIGCYEFWESGEISVEIERKQLTEGVYAPQKWVFSATIRPSTLAYDPESCWWTFDGTEPSESNHQAVGAVVTNVFIATTDPFRTIRFVLKVGDKTYADGHDDWIEVRSDKVFLVQENPNAAEPYATWETAATNFAQAFAWLGENSTLLISNGTYYTRFPEGSYDLPKNAAVRSVNGPDTVTIDGSRHADVPGKNHDIQLLFNLTHAGATIAGLRLKSIVNGWGTAGIAISDRIGNATGYLITNCVFDSCTTRGNSAAAISALRGPGLVVDCVMTNCMCREQANPHPYGLALQVSGTGAVADRCRVYGAVCEGLGVERRGAVGVTGGATLRNSLVAGCRAALCSGIYVGANSAVENCTVASNMTLTATDESFHAPQALWLADATATVTNTISALNVDDTGAAANAGGVDGWEANVGSSFIGGDAHFKNPARWNFRIRSGSPCVGQAVVLPWMDGALDADGNPRKAYDGAVDIGCYQASRNGLLLLVR